MNRTALVALLLAALMAALYAHGESLYFNHFRAVFHWRPATPEEAVCDGLATVAFVVILCSAAIVLALGSLRKGNSTPPPTA